MADPELREAIKDLSKAGRRRPSHKLDKFGAIQEIPDDAGRLAAIAEKQIDALEAQRSSLIRAPTHGFVVRRIGLVTGLAIAG
jgi:hypothetical protein